MDMNELVDDNEGKAIEVKEGKSFGTKAAGFMTSLGGGLKKAGKWTANTVRDFDRGLQEHRTQQQAVRTASRRGMIRDLQEQVQIAKLQSKLQKLKVGQRKQPEYRGGTPLEWAWNR